MIRLFSKILPLMLVALVLLPVCSKAFAAAELVPISSQNTLSSDGDPEGTPSLVPCLSCCGGWTAIHPKEQVLNVPQRQRVDVDFALFIGPHTHTPKVEIHGQRAPPNILPLNHTYSHMFSRTGRLLL